MGLSIVKNTGHVRPLSIADTFKLQVKHHTRPEIETFIRSLSGGDDEQARALAEFFLAGWSGCTRLACSRINVTLADDQPMVNDEVPFDLDAARDLWLNASRDEFADKIILFSKRIAEVIEEEKRLAKNAYGASSAPSTIHESPRTAETVS